MRNWLTLTEDERKELEMIATSDLAARHLQKRAKAILLAADGLPDHEIAAQAEIAEATVTRWVSRFRDRPAGSSMLSVLKTKEGRGKALKFDEAGREWVRQLALEKRNGMRLEKFTEYVQNHAAEAGYPSFASVSTSTLWIILHEK